jgi:SAM-dependent methyltransferase
MNSDHDAVTLDQFTRQAAPFAAMPAHADADIFDLIRLAARLSPAARVLDVACGPGLVSLALAPHAAHVTGLDVTPAMLDQARDLQRQRGLANLAWELGRADALPYPDAAFDAVVTRWSFHHLLDPAAALAEMVRVCRSGGRVVVADVYTAAAEQAAEYDRLEQLRDPSHTHALGLDDFRRLVRASGLADVAEAFSRLPLAVDDLLAASFPAPAGPTSSAGPVRRTPGPTGPGSGSTFGTGGSSCRSRASSSAGRGPGDHRPASGRHRHHRAGRRERGPVAADSRLRRYGFGFARSWLRVSRCWRTTSPDSSRTWRRTTGSAASQSTSTVPKFTSK